MLTLFVSAGVLGLFGKGPLSSETLEGNGFSIEYERYQRDETPTSLSIQIEQGSIDPILVALSRGFLERVRVQNKIPQQSSTVTDNDRITYSFNGSNGGLITIYLVPQHVGSLPLAFSILGQPVHINQFVYL